MNVNCMIPVLIRNALSKKKASDDLKDVAQDLWDIAMQVPKEQPLFRDLMASRDRTLAMSDRLLYDIDHNVALGCRI